MGGFSGAERQAKYRAKRKGQNAYNKGKSGKGGATSKWATGEFIALDGEGESIGETETFNVPNGGKSYEAKDHSYTLLAASTGESLFNGGKRLESLDCLRFLCDLADAHKKGIFVIFAGSYDINHILLFGLSKETVKSITTGSATRIIYDGLDYEIEYRARKSLTLRRGLSFVKDKHGKYKPKWQTRMTVWDVFGFFQENFVGVMGKWLGTNHRHYDLIKRMKAMRGDFASVPQSDINAYNTAELECLVELMDKVKAAVEGLDLVLNRWDGAGSIAAAIMRKHNIKDFKKETPPELIEAVSTAYAGGRIEVCKIGRYEGQIWDYDINSAYPYVMSQLPCLAHGKWITGTGSEPPPGFTLVHSEYSFPDNLPFDPLFYRTSAMQICFASRGEGIYWYPEYEAALNTPGGNINVIKWWHFVPECNHKPFHWIGDYYKTRQQWIKNPLEEWQSGGEKIIKLGLNSLYGKSAQQLGGRKDRPPAYHQMEWAGYITSATRARLYSAAALNRDAVIGFATDGIFTTSPLPFSHSQDKTMGEWDVKVFDGLTLAMAGVYWWHEAAAPPCGIKSTDSLINYKHYSRGFDKDAMKTPAPVFDAWKRGEPSIDIKMHRLIGMGSACASETFWKMRGRFTDGLRTLALNGGSFKRKGIDVKKKKPWNSLVDVAPQYNFAYENHGQGCSHPYPLEWMKNADFENELELERETEDTLNI